MRDFLAIIINKVITFTCLISKPVTHTEGSVVPGSFASKINRHILDDLKYPKYIVGVTGSSGKGSTTKLIANILTDNGYKVVWNKNGSNLFNAALTLILNNTNPFTKKINADVLLLELDESYIKEIFNKVNLTHLVITNITRDQVARNGEPEIIYKNILDALDPSTNLIINANDPFVLNLAIESKCPTIKYGLLKYKGDTKKPLSNTIDMVYCPICGEKLKYAYYHYGNIGSFQCPKCKFGTNPLQYKGTDINLQSKFMTINNHLVNINHGALFTSYGKSAAYALCNTIGLDETSIQNTLNKNYEDYNNENVFQLGKRKVEMLDSKPENALSYEQTIDYVLEQKGNLTVIIGFDNVSRRYDYNDISWLYDINFSKLKDPFIDKIVCIGRFKYDIALAMEYMGIDSKKIIIVDNYRTELKNLIVHKTKGNIYTIIFVDMMNAVKKALTEVK